MSRLSPSVCLYHFMFLTIYNLLPGLLLGNGNLLGLLLGLGDINGVGRALSHLLQLVETLGSRVLVGSQTVLVRLEMGIAVLENLDEGGHAGLDTGRQLFLLLEALGHVSGAETFVVVEKLLRAVSSDLC